MYVESKGNNCRLKKTYIYFAPVIFLSATCNFQESSKKKLEKKPRVEIINHNRRSFRIKEDEKIFSPSAGSGAKKDRRDRLS